MEYPNKIQVETFLGCNARCTMCTIHDWARPHGQMADAVFDRIVEQAADFTDHLAVMSLYMDGEPLMDAAMEARITQCKAAGLGNVGFSTNGSLLRPKRVAPLLDAGLDWVNFSFDTMDPEVYEATRVRLKFDSVYDNIRTFIEARNAGGYATKVILRYLETENPPPPDGFEIYKRTWSNLLRPEDEIQYSEVHNWGSAEGPLQVDGTVPCDYVFDNMIILRDGTVPLCCVDYNAEYIFGNVMEDGILDIWNSNAFLQVREQHRSGRRKEIAKCAQCNIPDMYEQSKRIYGAET